ncbi:MAG: XdhC/CoxF family protein, partial [Rhodospirillales bacterium]|nr:XdhC/CoxF family protein [Rhodospirillales bacterium]
AQSLIAAGETFGAGNLPATPELANAANAAIDQDACRIEEIDGRRLFIHVFSPPPRLIIVGAVHIAQPLAQMARIAGYSVFLVDPRPAFVERDGFAGTTPIASWPDEAITDLASTAEPPSSP